jgi:hypothetical protein
MSDTVFTHLRFWLLVIFSCAPSAWIYWLALAKRAMSRWLILQFGFSLVAIAGIDVYLLQTLKAQARLTTSVADDWIFDSEVSIALFLLPAMFGGIGINVISHVLVDHLVETKKRFTSKHTDN